VAKLKTQNSKLKTLVSWLIGALLLVVVLWLVFILAGRALPHIAVGQIAELTNTKIKAESVDFNIDGSVFIKKLVVSPYKRQSYDDTILRAETVYARFGIASLLLLRPRLKVIDVNDFVFNAQYDVDTDRWNLSALKIKVPQGGSGKMPRIHLEAGTLQYSKISNGKVKVAASVPIKASFGFDEEKQKGYSFDITTATLASGFGRSHLAGFWKPGTITAAGGVSSADVPALEMAWAIDVLAAEFRYDPNNAYSLKLRVRDFWSKSSPALDKFASIGPSFLERSAPFAALQRFFSRYSPAGRVDIFLDASGNLKQLAQGSLSGKIVCSDVSICDRKFPYPIEHLTGRIDFTEEGVKLNNLSGRHGDVKLFFNGWSRDFGPKWQYEIRMTSDNMALDNDLLDALSEKQKAFWSAFSPSGIAAIDYRLSRQSPADKQKALTVELLGSEAVYRHFPYPLKNLTGNLFFEQGSITFSDVVSQVNGRKIVINGKSMTSETDRPIYDVTIDVNNIPLDSTLEAALTDTKRELYAQFRPTGLADGKIKVFTPSPVFRQEDVGVNPATYIADLSFRESSLDWTKLPLAVSDISAKAVFTEDSIQIDDFTGRHAEGLFRLTGRIRLGRNAEQLRYSLKLNGQQSLLGDELFGLLPESMKKNVLEFQPQGRVNYIADLDKADSNGYPDYRIVVDCLGGSAVYQQFPYPLKDVTGRITIAKNNIKLNDITATAADSLQIAQETSSIKLNGEIALADNAFSSGRFHLDADNILFDEQLGVALPEGLKGLYRKLSPTGRFDVNSANIKISAADDDRKLVDFDGNVIFKVCDFNLPGAVTGLAGELEAKGLYKTGDGFQDGQAILSAQRLTIIGKALTDLKADLYYNDSQQNWFTRNLVADCYGGGLTGKLEFKRSAEGLLEYLLQIGFENIDLKQYLSDTAYQARSAGGERRFNGHTSGKMNGSLSVAVMNGESPSRIGRCRLAISDMQVGELSPMAKLMQVLKLTETKDFVFDRMLVDSYIKRDRVFFEQFDLSGESLAFSGSGWMGLQDRNIDLVLTARGARLAAADPSIFQALAEGLTRAVVRMKVTGSVYNPKVETKTFPVIEDSLQILGTKPDDLNP